MPEIKQEEKMNVDQQIRAQVLTILFSFIKDKESDYSKIDLKQCKIALDTLESYIKYGFPETQV